MYESDFVLMENETMSLEALRQELSNIIQNKCVYNAEQTKRSVSQQPKPEDRYDTFYIRFDVEDSNDFISVVADVSKEKHLVDYDLNEKGLTVKLINYNKRDRQ